MAHGPSSAEVSHPRIAVTARILSGSVGAYLLASAAAFLLARLLPMDRSESATTATLVALLVMPAAAIWAFSPVALRWSAGGTWGTAALFAAIAFLHG